MKALTLGRWNDTDVRVLRAACECAPCRAAFFAVFAFAVDDVGVGFVAAVDCKRKRDHASYHQRLCVGNGRTDVHLPLPGLPDFVVAIARESVTHNERSPSAFLPPRRILPCRIHRVSSIHTPSHPSTLTPPSSPKPLPNHFCILTKGNSKAHLEECRGRSSTTSFRALRRRVVSAQSGVR
jgi:hypothetical protein